MQAERKVTQAANSQDPATGQATEAQRPAVSQTVREQLIMPQIAPSATPATETNMTAFSGFSGVQHAYSNELAMDDAAEEPGFESPAEWTAVLASGAVPESSGQQVRWGYRSR